MLRTKTGSPYVIAGMEILLGQADARVVVYEAKDSFLMEAHFNIKALLALRTIDTILPVSVVAYEEVTSVIELTASFSWFSTHYSDRIKNVPTEKEKTNMGGKIKQTELMIAISKNNKAWVLSTQMK